MYKRRDGERVDELHAALNSWKESLRRFETACGDEVKFASLEVEAAEQKYIYLLNRRKSAEAAGDAEAGGSASERSPLDAVI